MRSAIPTQKGGKTIDPANHGYDLEDFYAAVKAGNFPAVSYIKMPAYQDGHAGYSDPLDEQAGNVELINFLQKQPEWRDTAVIITYDDSDGWYDHAVRCADQTPPTMRPPIRSTVPVCAASVRNKQPAPKGLNSQPVNGRCGPGTRVPFIVVSPYAKKNFVSSTTFRRLPWCASSKTIGCTASAWAAVRSTKRRDRSWICSISTATTPATIR